jgi:hypothetical protein
MLAMGKVRESIVSVSVSVRIVRYASSACINHVSPSSLSCGIGTTAAQLHDL